MNDGHEVAAMGELRVGVEAFLVEGDACGETGLLQSLHQLAPVTFAGCVRDRGVQLLVVAATVLVADKPRIVP